MHTGLPDTGFPIPNDMLQTLQRAAVLVGREYLMHDMFEIVMEDEQLVPPIPSGRILLHRELTTETVTLTPLKPLVFDIVSIGDQKILAGQPTCPVCLSDYEHGDRCSVLPCKHGFHNKCILEWTKEHSTCPMCRVDLR